jgi:mono/diheme cytochrome c family protein
MKTWLPLFVALLFGATALVSFTHIQNNVPTAPTPTYTPAQIAKGRYLVQIMGCADCHAPKQFGPQGPVPDPALGLSGHPANVPVPPVNKEAAGGWVLFHPMNTIAVGPWGASFAANLTPHETGIGNWTEAQFIIALTEGKSKGIRTARPLLPPMPWPNYVGMKKEDLVAMFAYLKSCKPVENNVPQPIGPDKL